MNNVTKGVNMIEEGTISFMFYNDDTVYTDEFDNDEPVTHYET